jgi:hypothetical protein
MEVPRQYIGANVRLESHLGLTSLKTPVNAVMHVMLLMIMGTVSIYLCLSWAIIGLTPIKWADA